MVDSETSQIGSAAIEELWNLREQGLDAGSMSGDAETLEVTAWSWFQPFSLFPGHQTTTSFCHN